ncbi:MAG TPA: UDP-N-acetylmuramoyl-tripeptide--D-alanyl-D-alanine ligase [Thermoanaerobaculia bacterium]|nr:UDP-N-acetylmuramoyl-tripeptide--D-alanyl-D-alanine ligase [Thermoanaerobaculia bacterium]
MHGSAAEAARAMAGRVLSGDPEARWGGAAIDSRAVSPGSLFFAFPGARTDGHLFVADAFARGAAGAVVERPVEAGEGFLLAVADAGDALVALAREMRSRAPEKLAGITGSAGKTTTKELLAAMLARRFRVARTAGNFNNRIGLPISMLNVPDGTEWMVAELGMSSAGELRELSLLARPDVAIFTVVRAAHLEFFDSVAAIAEAKAELLAGLGPNGLIVANADDPEVVRIARRHAESRGGRIVWYGQRAAADVRATGAEPLPAGEVGSRFRLEVPDGGIDVRLALHGLYNVENCLAAAAAAWALGVPLAEIAAAAAAARPASKRGVVHRLRLGADEAAREATLIDDSYNSNPDALEKALAAAAELPASRRIAILGEMRELGPESPRFHREAGARAAALGFSPILGVGALAGELVAAATAAGALALHLPDAAAAADWAAREIGPGDLLLVKASRGVRLEQVAERVLALATPERTERAGGEA